MLLFMFEFVKSRQSLLLVICLIVSNQFAIAQQKANDFTKRVWRMDGKMNSNSGFLFSGSRLNALSTQRIRVEQWPSKFSSFGSKRFPMNGTKNRGDERIGYAQIPIALPLNDRIAQENQDRVSGESFQEPAPASSAVEFRDAYYAKLDKRVDDWMNKVNNLSLRDINRFQFRKGRSSEPGFPVQRAGAAGSQQANKLKSIGPSQTQGTQSKLTPAANPSASSYWMGPTQIKKSSNVGRVLPNTQESSGGASKKNFKSAPKPILGPKKIRVEVAPSK